jgi:anti-sigma28 factor (negative regulator of flagellin synthesis)
MKINSFNDKINNPYLQNKSGKGTNSTQQNSSKEISDSMKNINNVTDHINISDDSKVRLIQKRIESGYYDNIEVLHTTAQKVIKDIEK